MKVILLTLLVLGTVGGTSLPTFHLQGAIRPSVQSITVQPRTGVDLSGADLQGSSPTLQPTKGVQ